MRCSRPVVGAELDFVNGHGAGSAYIFARIDGERMLCTCALQGQVVLIGATGIDDLGSVSGAAYLYALVTDEWQEQVKFCAADGSEGDGFGSSVDLDGNTIVVGAPGEDVGAVAAYLFRMTGSPLPAVDWTGTVLLVIIVLGAGSYLIVRRRMGIEHDA